MKTLSRLPLLMLFLVSGLLTNAQEIKRISEEASASWKEQLEKLSELTQTPLKQNQSSLEAVATTQNVGAMEVVSIQDLIKESKGSSKSAEYSELNWQKQLAKIDEASKRRSIQSSGQPQFKLSDGNVSKENELIEQNNYYENMKLAIHERNVRQQQQIIRQGGSLKAKSVLMGPKTGLELDPETDKSRVESLRKLDEENQNFIPDNINSPYINVESPKTVTSSNSTLRSISKSSIQRTSANFRVPPSTVYDTLEFGIDNYPTIDITDNGEGIGTVTFTTDYIYRFIGVCFVNDGDTLTINPGVVIKGYQYQPEPSMLVIAKGGMLVAQGTESAPIIFTAESDGLVPPASSNNLDGSYDQYTSGLWGGVAILGDGLVNNVVGETHILGGGEFGDDPRFEFGGDDSQSNNGTIMQYVSIRHTGESSQAYNPGEEPFNDGFESDTLFNSNAQNWNFNTGGGLGEFTISDFSFTGSNALEVFVGDVSTNELDVSAESGLIGVTTDKDYTLTLEGLSYTSGFSLNVVVMTEFGEELGRTNHVFDSVETWSTVNVYFNSGSNENVYLSLRYSDPNNVTLVSNTVVVDDVILSVPESYSFRGLADGLSLAGVDDGAIIDHIEILGASGVGLSFMGGYVNASHIITRNCDDDLIATDYGYNGKLQFLLGFESEQFRAAHFGSGGSGAIDEGRVYNATFIGSDEFGFDAVKFEGNAGGHYYNSIFQGFGGGINVEYKDTVASSYDKLQSGALNIKNNIFWQVNGGDYLTVIDEAGTFTGDIYTEPSVGGNVYDDPQLDGSFVPSNSYVFDFFNSGDDFFQATSYAGAFEPGVDPWTFNWSYTGSNGSGSGGTTSLDNTFLAGDWKIEPIAGALGVGPTPLDLSYWSNNTEDISIRACQFDDIWTFDEFGNLSLELQGQTWLEAFQGMNEGCGTPVAPHDGSGNYTYTVSDASITVSGQGIYLGIPKVYNGGELTAPSEAPESITYAVNDFYEEGGVKRMTLTIESNSGVWWTFRMINQAPASIDIDPDDYNALLAIRDALGGNLTTEWSESVSPSNWPYIEYSGNKVFTLSLDGTNLNGDIPVALTSLDQLNYLSIGGNNITSLPEGIGSLTNLKHLWLWGNNLQGLPSDFFDLSSTLEILDLSHNTALGEATAVSIIQSFTNLEGLYLRELGLTSIPDEIGNIQNLNTVDFTYNSLQSLPASFFTLDQMQRLYLGDNDLEMSFSELLVFDSLRSINCFSNNISGTLEGISSLTKLQDINLSDNLLTGSVPAEIGGLTNLYYLNFSYNELTGTLPPEISQLINLNYLLLQWNGLTGSIPQEYAALEALVRFYIFENDLSGEIPDIFGNWYQIERVGLSDNQFTGAVPSTLATRQSLQQLYVNNNQLSAFPESVNMPFLGLFWAFGNNFEFDDLEPALVLLNSEYIYDYQIAPQNTPELPVQYMQGGERITLDASIGGSENHYQWYYNGNPIEGIDSAVYVIESLEKNSVGYYWCEISNDLVTPNTSLTLSSGEWRLFFSAPIAESDSLALVEIYEATNGENWNNAYNWLNAPVMSWEGVFIENERVTKLDLFNKNLQSGLPPAIGDLDALTWLSLYNNPNMGYVPGEFYGLTNLTYLDLDNSGLRRLSPGIKEMTNLDTLWVGGNPYENKLPLELFNLTGLMTLGLHNTPFEGQLPSEIGQLVNLKQLWLNNNPGVIGNIPASFENLTELEYLNIANSGFTGGLEHVGALTSLKQLYIYAVPAAHDELPDNFANLTNMERFGLGFADYDLRGFPEEIFSMTRLKVLQLPASNINKDIPEGFANLDSLQFLNLRDNGLGITSFGFGSSVFFPEGMATDSLYSVYIQGNNFDDISIFENSTKLTNFYAYGNKLDFEDLLPFEEYMSTHENYTQYNFSNMQPLERQYVQLSPGESITFNPPLSYDEYTFVDYYKDEEYLLSLERDSLVGFLQAVTLENVTNPEFDGFYDGYLYHEIISPLSDLTLHHDSRNIQVVESVLESDSLALIQFRDHFIADNPYHFEGWALEEGDDIPVENWPGVVAYGGKVLGIQMNGLTGTLPVGVFNQFDSLTTIYLADGQLTGSIPADVFTAEIQSIDFGRNNLTGSIPEINLESGALEFLGLAGNQLSGEIPASLANFTGLSQLYLDDNRLTGAIPSSFLNLSFGGFSVDRNRLTDIPADFFFALEGAFYSNFEYNQFGADDLINGLGNNVSADYSYAPQGEVRELTWSGDANLEGTVTLHAERLHSADQFYWFRQNKYNGLPYYDQIGSSGTDSTFNVYIEGEWAQANYMVVVLNSEYKYGEYPFFSEQVPVDPYEKRFASSQTGSTFDNPNDYGADLSGAVGYPDVPPTFSPYEFEGRAELDWWRYDGWWKNPNEPEVDTLELGYDNPIPVNYVRLHSPANDLRLNTLVLVGTGGEEAVFAINRSISNDENQITFPKTAFPVSSVKLVLTGGSIDAFEIGDTGVDVIESPVVEDYHTPAGPDFLYININYAGLADYIVVERSVDGEIFEVIDSIGYVGYYRDDVVPGKYYYRAKAVFEGLGLESDYSEVVESGNCEPTIPSNKIWKGTSVSLDDSSQLAGLTGVRDTMYVNEIFRNNIGEYGENEISDLTAGWFDQFWEYYEEGGLILEKCDLIKGYSYNGTVSRFEGYYESDTLYIDWWADQYGIHGLSKYWVIGDQEEGDYFLERPYSLTAELQSKSAISLAWEDNNPDSTSYIIQASVDVASNFENIDMVTAVHHYSAPNTLDGQYRFYRVIATYNDESTYPSNEVSIIHKAPLFDFVENEVSQDINRTSYGGSWGDFDADGDDDLYVSNATFDDSQSAKNFLYENTGNGTFRKVVGTLATAEDRFTRSATWGDYNNDGFMDIYSPGVSEQIPDRIYQNTGSRSFVLANEDVMAATAHTYSPSETGVWVDLNNDGWLDLVKSTGFVLMNDGTGLLTVGDELEIPDGPLSTLRYYFWSVSNIDIDSDGDQDIYITSDAQNMLFINDGSGNMTYHENEISNSGLASRGYSWADFDNDGLMDLLTGEGDMNQFGVYKNLGNLEFYFVAQGSSEGDEGSDNGSDFTAGRGYTVADFNNDGMVDVLLNVNGRATIAINRGFFNFEPINIEDQAFPLMNLFSHVAVADVNLDGFVDVFLPNQDVEGSNFVYLNNANSNSWITVQLKGIRSNKSGIGARITVESNLDQVFTQQVISQNGLGSGNSLAAEFGLGSATSVNKITVYWPSGDTTVAESVATNQVFTMVEVVEEEGGGPTVNESDSTILSLLYDELGGENWINNQGWGEGSPLAWEGTFWSTPDPESEDLPRLISLVLNGNNLTDTIPGEIGGLTELQILDFSQNNLSGNIPSSIGNLTKLVNLSLNDNQLTGKIPASVGTLANLENLDLFNNNMFGELPRTLGGLVNLKQFEIQNNDFIGFVPAVIGTLNNLEILRMDNNQFEGVLPDGLGAMESLAVLYLNDNQFTGELPDDLGDLSNLSELRIYNNEFFGIIPATFSKLQVLEYLDISNNDFDGSLSPFSSLSSLYYFNASQNRFSSMGDFSDITSDTVIVTNNWLDFGDFDENELLIIKDVLAYNPQDSLFEEEETLHGVGVPIDFGFSIGGSGNVYTWKLNGEIIESDANVSIEGSSVSIIRPDSPNQGDYVLEITNDKYPDVTLVTRPYTLKLTSYERDKQALLAFKAAVQNTYDLSSWVETDTLSNWEGVTLSDNPDNLRVIGLELPGNPDDGMVLKGAVPSSFADLSGIEILNLAANELSSFPNISKWPNVTSVDLRRNRLKFASLIPNVKLGTKIQYDPQRRLGTTLFDTLVAGDDPILFIENQGFGAKYQWQFGKYIPGQFYNNDVEILDDANSRVYQIQDLDYDQMGTYRVSVTHDEVPGLVLQSRNQNIMAATTLFGTVYAVDDTNPVTAGEVITFRKTPVGPFVPEDTVQISTSAEFQFNNVVLGDFLLLTKPDRDVYPITTEPGSTVIVDSYYDTATLYDDAKTLEVRQRSSGLDIFMSYYEIPEPIETGADFNGLVESDIEQDTLIDEEARILARKKVKRAACSMRRYTGSGRLIEEDSVFTLYAYVESDDEGNFKFEGIEDGIYKLNIQYPGVPMDPDSDITFEVGGDKENQEFEIKAVITEEGIQVEQKEVLYTLKPYIKDVMLYPNPTEGKLKADFLVYRRIKDLKLEVTDIRGVKLLEQELSPRMGTQSAVVDLTNFESGVYFLVFTDSQGTFKHQVKVSRK